MELYQFSEIQIICFALVLIRVSAFFVSFPLIEGGNMPAHIKILFSLACTFVLYPVIDSSKVTQELISESLIFISIKEVLVGVLIGFIARFFFFIVGICGELVTTSIGLSADQMFMPNLNRRVTIVEQFELLLATLIFLGVNGHHFFIEGLVQSFNFVQIQEITFNTLAFRDLSLVGIEIISMGIKLSAPVLGAIFITNISMGIVGRAVPQINVLVTSWPVNILLGFSMLFVSLPLFIWTLKENISWNAELLFDFLKKI